MAALSRRSLTYSMLSNDEKIAYAIMVNNLAKYDGLQKEVTTAAARAVWALNPVRALMTGGFGLAIRLPLTVRRIQKVAKKVKDRTSLESALRRFMSKLHDKYECCYVHDTAFPRYPF